MCRLYSYKHTSYIVHQNVNICMSYFVPFCVNVNFNKSFQRFSMCICVWAWAPNFTCVCFEFIQSGNLWKIHLHNIFSYLLEYAFCGVLSAYKLCCKTGAYFIQTHLLKMILGKYFLTEIERARRYYGCKLTTSVRRKRVNYNCK